MGVILKGSSGSITLTVPKSSGSTGDLSNYYTKSEVDALIPDVSGLATETYVDNAIANIPTGGGETWRLVRDITLDTDDVGTLEFTTDADGKALNLKQFALIGKAKASAAASTYITINGKAFLSNASPYQSYSLRPFQLQGDFCKGFLTLQLVGAANTAVSGVNMYTHIYSGNFSTSALEKIKGSGLTQLKISPQTSTVTLLTGSHVELWGVDA